MFANSNGPILNMALSPADVLLTPPLAVPIPFPNIAIGFTSIPTVFNVFYMCMPAQNMFSERVPTIDGIGVGVASGTDMGPSRDLIGSTNYNVDCAPQTKMTMPTLQNLTNAPGINISPAQVVVLVLS